MQTAAITVLLLSSFSLCEAVKFAELLRFTSASATTTAYAVPGSTPDSYVPTITQVLDGAVIEALDLRQAPAVPPAVPVPVAPAAPANPPIAIPAAPLPVPPAPLPVPPAPPAPPGAVPVAPPAVPPAAAPKDPSLSVTVQWVETWVGGTSRTWVPHTITLHYQAQTEAPPEPGKGQIGMGTLTGELGVTKTIIKGAANTIGPEWKVGAVAAVGLGIAGLV